MILQVLQARLGAQIRQKMLASDGRCSFNPDLVMLAALYQTIIAISGFIGSSDD